MDIVTFCFQFTIFFLHIKKHYEHFSKIKADISPGLKQTFLQVKSKHFSRFKANLSPGLKKTFLQD